MTDPPVSTNNNNNQSLGDDTPSIFADASEEGEHPETTTLVSSITASFSTLEIAAGEREVPTEIVGSNSSYVYIRALNQNDNGCDFHQRRETEVSEATPPLEMDERSLLRFSHPHPSWTVSPWIPKNRKMVHVMALLLFPLMVGLAQHYHEIPTFFHHHHSSESDHPTGKSPTSSPTLVPFSPSPLPSTYSPSPISGRRNVVMACASFVSARETISSCHYLSDEEEDRCKAVDYFVTGLGNHIDIEDCRDPKSLFTVLYSMVVIRESLQISDVSWQSRVEDLSDICRKWKRVKCGLVGGNAGAIPAITSLSLNHGHKFQGTLPPEIQGLWGLQELFLFSNTGISGKLPLEMGTLSYLQTLEIHYSSLSGNVPTQFGALKNLETFRAYGTRLTGTMPAEVCALVKVGGNLVTLEADCVMLGCDCCTACKQRTTAANEMRYAVV